MRKVLTALAATATLAFGAASADAAVLSGNVTGGSAGGSFVELFPAPGFTIGQDNLQSDNLFAFDEKQGVTLTSAIGSIASGTAVNSHYVAFDPRQGRTIRGNVTFSGRVLGVITTLPTLQATDALFGLPGVNYLSPTARGLESNDSISFSGNQVFLNWRASSPGDHVRVLTAVPEPSTWAMMLAGFMAVGGMIRSRRRSPAMPALA